MNELNIKTMKPGGYVSTVRLEDYPGEVYETIIFTDEGGSHEYARYSTQWEAIEGHFEACQ
jgi:hypothetical protein